MDEMNPPAPPPASSEPPPPPAFGASPPPPPPPSAHATLLPWEQPGYPLLAALFETTKLFLTKPRESFERSSPAVGAARPFLYGCILAFVLNFSSAVYQFLMRSVMGKESLPAPWSEIMGGEMTIPPIALLAANVLLSPFLIPLGILVAAGILHLILLIFGGAPGRFSGTLRAISYAHAPMVWAIIPLCGFVVGGIWSVVLTVIGLTVIHRVSTGKAVFVVLLPAILCCLCFIPLFFLSGLRHMMRP